MYTGYILHTNIVGSKLLLIAGIRYHWELHYCRRNYGSWFHSMDLHLWSVHGH